MKFRQVVTFTLDTEIDPKTYQGQSAEEILQIYKRNRGNVLSLVMQHPHSRIKTTIEVISK